MNTLQEEALFWNTLSTRIVPAVRLFLKFETIAARDKMESASPVGKTGRFAAGWWYRENSTAGTVIASTTISNKAKHAPPIELGIDVASDHVWAKSYRIKQGRVKKGSGLSKKDGRIYSKKAVGGVGWILVGKPGYQRDMARRLADQVMKVIFK